MVQMNTRVRTLRSSDEVMAEIEKRAPSLMEHCFMDRDWIWICNIDLRGEHNKPLREAIKDIGFRFSPGGHVMQDGQTRGHWGHSCTKPMHPRRRYENKGDRNAAATTETSEAEMLRSLGL